ncbi:MAG: hypothetical protein SFV81_11930 [Pirellulaceae bacterium]|nr:hypothetical protein [Pirellulaceae bacterium]
MTNHRLAAAATAALESLDGFRYLMIDKPSRLSGAPTVTYKSHPAEATYLRINYATVTP